MGIITCPRSQSHRHPRLSVGVWADYKHVKRNKERARNARKWLLNPIQGETEYADHHKRARSQGNRLDNAWFGAAANIKDAVFHEVLELTS